MVDKKSLHRDLIDGFILREYADFFGVMDCDFREKAIKRYMNDPRFHARVQSVVCEVLRLVDIHDK